MLNNELLKIYAEKKNHVRGFRRALVAFKKGDYDAAAVASVKGDCFKSLQAFELEATNKEFAAVELNEKATDNRADESLAMDAAAAMIDAKEALANRDLRAADIGMTLARLERFATELAAARREKDEKKRAELLREFRKANK